ncbi:MAG TPA: LysM peptidoglycan-binding domain-containing protein [Anaerolineae bacterium]|nr:LysM peptidoglycan-binding domain-containing protein [Anaerolineae bacterium]
MSYSSRSRGARSGKRSVWIVLALFAALAALGAFRFLQNRSESRPTTAALLVTNGEATVIRADANAEPPLQQGETATLQRGDEVRTGIGSAATLTFAGGATIELGSETHLALLDLSLTPVARAVAAVLSLNEGKTLTHIPHAPLQGASFEIETRVTTVRARGTEFQCNAMRECTYVEVFDGVVTVSMGEQSVELEAGQSLRACLGESLVPVSSPRPSPPEAATVAGTEPNLPTLTDSEKTLFPPVLTPTRPEDLFQLYTVRKGDTLYSIAARFGVSWEAVWAANKDRLSSPELVRTGQELRIPKP